MRRGRLLVILISVGLIVFVLLAGLEIVAEANGHSLDPTDQMNYNTYALRNDSRTQLYVHLCADERCARLDGPLDWVAVKPGSADEEQVYWGSPWPTVYAVALRPSGAEGRCVVLNAAKKASATVDVPLSSAGVRGG